MNCAGRRSPHPEPPLSPSRPHVLLLQPPSEALVERDAPEPRWSGAAGPRWPWPLLAEAARLRGRALVSVLDAQALRLRPEAALELAWHLRPDRVFALVGGLGCSDDPGFVLRLRERLPGATLLIGGPALFGRGAAALRRFEAADGVVLQPGAAGPGYEQGPGAPHVAWRGGPTDHPGAPDPALPPPPIELFPWPRYRELGWRGGLLGAPLIGLPAPAGPPVLRSGAALQAELQAWRAAGARGLSLRGAPLPLGAPEGLAELLRALRALGLPWTAALGPRPPTGGEGAALRAAGCRRLRLGLRLEDNDTHVIINGERAEIAALADAFAEAEAPPLELRVDGIDGPPAVARALALADRLAAPHLDLRPEGAAPPSPPLQAAIAAARRRAQLRPARWRAAFGSIRGPRRPG